MGGVDTRRGGAAGQDRQRKSRFPGPGPVQQLQWGAGQAQQAVDAAPVEDVRGGGQTGGDGRDDEAHDQGRGADHTESVGGHVVGGVRVVLGERQPARPEWGERGDGGVDLALAPGDIGDQAGAAAQRREEVVLGGTVRSR